MSYTSFSQRAMLRRFCLTNGITIENFKKDPYGPDRSLFIDILTAEIQNQKRKQRFHQLKYFTSQIPVLVNKSLPATRVPTASQQKSTTTSPPPSKLPIPRGGLFNVKALLSKFVVKKEQVIKKKSNANAKVPWGRHIPRTKPQAEKNKKFTSAIKKTVQSGRYVKAVVGSFRKTFTTGRPV